MKKILFILLILNIFILADDKIELVLQEIKNLREDMNILREDMNKRFEQVDKRFEQVDKRFEQVDEKFNFLKELVFLLIALTVASPFLAMYLRDKREAHYEKVLSTLQGVVFSLKKMAKNDKELAESLKYTNIL